MNARARTASPSGGRAVPPGRHQQQRSHHCKQPRTEEPVCTEQTHTHSSGQHRTDEAEKKGAGTFGNTETGKLDSSASLSSGKKSTDYHHVQLGETGARWPQQGRRDVPDGDGRTADPLHQEAAAAGGDLPLP